MPRPKKEEYFKEIVPRWVIRTLKENGNCYVNHRLGLTMEELSYVVGFNLSMRQLQDGKGWVIERVVK